MAFFLFLLVFGGHEKAEFPFWSSLLVTSSLVVFPSPMLIGAFGPHLAQRDVQAPGEALVLRAAEVLYLETIHA